MAQEMNTAAVDIFAFGVRLGRRAKKLWPVLLALAVLVGGVRMAAAFMTHTPVYAATVRFTVLWDPDAEGFYDDALAQTLAQEVPQILHTPVLRQRIAQQLGVEAIREEITVQAEAQTNLFTLTVRGTDRQAVYRVAQAAPDCYGQVAEQMGQLPRIRICRQPQLPTAPVNPFSWPDALCGGIVWGLLASGLLLVTAACAHKTLTHSYQCGMLSRLPLLAEFPRRRKYSGAKQGKSMAQQLQWERSQGQLAAGLNMTPGDDGRILMVTSATAQEGKTTVAVSLAEALCRQGRTVVLVDCDLRKRPQAIQDGHPWSVRRLRDMLENGSAAAGCPRLEPGELTRALQPLRRAFSCIVLDGADWLSASETEIICSCADDAVFVIRRDGAALSQIYRALEALQAAHAPLRGIVLNEMPRER